MLALKGSSDTMETSPSNIIGRGHAEDLGHEMYGAALRSQFSRREILEIIDEGRKRVWPRLNRDPVQLVTSEQFVKHWSSLDVEFRLAELAWPDGLALLGFYI